MGRTANNELVFYTSRGTGICAWKEYGIRMGDGFIDTISEPVTFKEYVVNESATEHGVRLLATGMPMVKSRDVMLTITIEGDTPDSMRNQRNSFMEFVMGNNGALALSTADDPETIYRLYMIGKGGEYGRSLDGCFCKMCLKFTEPNPSNRGK